MDTKKLVKKSCVVALLFIFYGLSKLTRGATYNPLTIIAYAAADITHFPSESRHRYMMKIPFYILFLHILFKKK